MVHVSEQRFDGAGNGQYQRIIQSKATSGPYSYHDAMPHLMSIMSKVTSHASIFRLPLVQHTLH